MNENPYSIYILRCEDGSLYTGITTDLERRFEEHKKGGARYTAGRRPLTVEAAWTAQNRSDALKLEMSIKKLKKAEKEGLIRGDAISKIDFSLYSRQEVPSYLQVAIL